MPPRTHAAALLLAAGVTLAGCSSGGGDDASGATGTAPSESTAQTTSAGPATTTTSAPATTTTAAPAPIPLEVHTTPWPGPTPPASAAAVARDLARVEVALRDPASPAAAVPELALTQQVAYRVLGVRREWRAEVVASVPPSVRAAVDANAEALAQLTDLGRAPRENLPTWRIAAPRPAAELVGFYKEAAAAVGIRWEVLAAINLVETRMGRTIVSAGAPGQGPMQFEAGAWKSYGRGDIQDPRDAIFAAARLLAANGYARDRIAVRRYNPRPNYVPAIAALTSVLEADERAYLGYHGWQVFYRLQGGDVLLPESWSNL